MRGAHIWLWPHCKGRGIIPADAGSTLSRAGAWRSCRDHPRGCGEHLYMGTSPQSPQGSSPRMRGALKQAMGTAWSWRIIPADAGSTCTTCRVWISRRDHPRGCGEHHPRVSEPAGRRGSSPRMRGAPFTGTWGFKDYEDHPRGCGEHTMTNGPSFHPVGSSPRMRGARQ